MQERHSLSSKIDKDKISYYASIIFRNNEMFLTEYKLLIFYNQIKIIAAFLLLISVKSME